MEINSELIAYLEELSRLRLTDEEKEDARVNLGKILGYIDKLGELDTQGVEALSHPFAHTNRFREDQVQPSFDQEAILACAPEQQDGCFRVPKTVE